jgi:DNA-binding XRE family transcriptional regulator
MKGTSPSRASRKPFAEGSRLAKKIHREGFVMSASDLGAQRQTAVTKERKSFTPPSQLAFELINYSMANRVTTTLQYADHLSGLTSASSAAACHDW